MIADRRNIVLIGMPGSGKSTVGIILAKQTAMDFVDTDVLIQTAQGRTLQQIVDADGHMALRRIEEAVLCELDCAGHVVATGGSAVYSPAAMDHLKAGGDVVFLDVDLSTLEARIDDYATRGLARRPDQSLTDLFAERFRLYQRYADMAVACADLTQEQVCREIVRALTGSTR